MHVLTGHTVLRRCLSRMLYMPYYLLCQLLPRAPSKGLGSPSKSTMQTQCCENGIYISHSSNTTDNGHQTFEYMACQCV